MCSTFRFSGFKKSKLLIVFLLFVVSSLFSFTFEDVDFWAGQGSSEAILVVDWQDDQPALVWGYKFTYMTSGADMLNAIAELDERLTFNGSSFVNDLIYTVDEVQEHSGLHGEPNYWSLHQSTVEGDSLDWSHFGGLTFTIQDGQALGCSYGTEDPTNDYNNFEIVSVATTTPDEPSFEDIEYWVGEGDNEAALVIDWFDGIEPRSLIWGYRWDGDANGLDMIQAIANADQRLSGDFDAMVSEVQYDLNNDGSIDDSDHDMGMNDYPTGYWSYFLKEASTEDWSYSSTGIAGRTLTDGCWDGWVFVQDWSITEFPYPAVPAQAPVEEPEYPIEFWDVTYRIGQGTDLALFVVDWNDETETPSLAWGYYFNEEDNVTVASMMNQIAEADGRLDIDVNSMLNEITYTVDETVQHTSVDGGDWWSTWTWSEDYGWTMNGGVSTRVSTSHIYGCSYGFTPAATQPDNPIAVDEYVDPSTGPSAYADTYYIRNDIAYQLHILYNDYDNLDGQSLEVTSQPQHGTVTADEDGIVEYLANEGYEGSDSFMYTVCDEDGLVSNEVPVILNLYPAFTGGADIEGNLAIANDSEEILAWATGIELVRGPQFIADEDSPLASYGSEDDALGYAEGNSTDVVSLGDGGIATLSFETAIADGQGPDFAVFENAFMDTTLELAFVEVSSNGYDWVRFPATSYTQNEIQLNNDGGIDCKSINNLAGKYRQGFGTPFDLAQLEGASGLDLNSVSYVRIIDVIGSISDAHSTLDCNDNIINDPFPTNFESSGFDLDGVAVLNDANSVAIAESDSPSVNTTELFGAYPNPFNPETTISFNLADSEKCSLRVYNLKGQLVKTLVKGQLSKGAHAVTWKGQDESNKSVASGLYFYKLSTASKTCTKKMTLQK